MKIKSKNMKIWYVHPYLGVPDNANYGRGFFLARGLKKLNISCRVITSSFHHLIDSDYEQIDEVYDQEIDGVPFTWLKTPKYVGNSVGRIFNMILFGVRFWMIDLVKKYNYEKPEVIVITSTHPFHTIAGIHWAKEYNAKLIFEIRDLWPLSLNELLGMSVYHPLSLFLSYLEKKSYKNADQVISVLPNASEHMINNGLDPEKFNYIPNGIHVETKDYVPLSRYRDFIENLKRQGAFIVMYTGAHGVPNHMQPLVEAAEIIQRSDKNIKFVFIGKGGCKDGLEKYAVDNSISNIHFLDPIPRIEVPDTLELADLVFIGGKNMPLYRFGVSPNKMFEYMYAAKPVLMTITSPNNPVEVSKAGSCIGSNDPQILADEILRYARMSEDELVAIGQRGKEYVEAHHMYTIIAEQYLQVISKIE